MNILLFGVSNVGKTTIGKIMAEKLGYSFYDLDDEVKKYYGYKNLDAFLRDNSFLSDRDQKRGYVVELLLKQPDNKVIAVAPIYYTRYYTIGIKRAVSEVKRVEIQDRPENIFERLVFADEDDIIYKDDEYKNRHKAAYIKQIKADISGYKAAFSKIEYKIDIAGKDANEAADYIISQLEIK